MRKDWNLEEFTSFLADTLLSDESVKFMEQSFGSYVSVIDVKGNTLEVSLSNGNDFIIRTRKK